MYLSGTCITYGFVDIISHSAPQTRPTMAFIIPRTRMGLVQFREIMVMPTLPMRMPKQLMRAAADPVSPLCCSSIRFVAGVRRQLAEIVAGMSARAKTRADGLQKTISIDRSPLCLRRRRR